MKLNVLVILFAILVFTGGTSTLAQTQNTSADAASLMPLVGKKCTLFINNGDKVSGTLWDYGQDYITLKVKKGLLYSKAEKFPISDIKYLQDSKGKKIKLSGMQTPAPKESTESQTDADESGMVKQMAEKDLFENTLRILTVTKSDEDEVPAPTKSTETFQSLKNTSINANTYLSKNTAKKPDAKPSNPAAPKNKKSSYSYSPPKTNWHPPVPKRKEIFSEDATTPKKAVVTVVEQTPEQQTETEKVALTATAAPAATSAAVETVKTLRYQNFILYGSGILLILLVAFFKGFGLKGSAYGKHSLFPTRLIRMTGPYGIIDQGQDDGVKLGDVVRIYRKSERRIQFKGKVKVTKIAQNYSAVELLKIKGDTKLGAGDVGVRDRNLVLNSMKGLQALTSVTLGALAKLLAFTAQNLAVEKSKLDFQSNSDLIEPTHETPVQEVTELVQKVRYVNNQDKDAPETPYEFDDLILK